MILKINKFMRWSNFLSGIIVTCMTLSLLYFVKNIEKYVEDVDNKLDNVFLNKEHYNEVLFNIENDLKKEPNTVIKYIERNNCSNEKYYPRLILDIFRMSENAKNGIIFSSLLTSITERLNNNEDNNSSILNLIKEEKFISLAGKEISSRDKIRKTIQLLEDSGSFITENYFFKISKRNNKEDLIKIIELIDEEKELPVINKDDFSVKYEDIINSIEDRIYVDNVIKKLINILNNNY